MCAFIASCMLACFVIVVLVLSVRDFSINNQKNLMSRPSIKKKVAKGRSRKQKLEKRLREGLNEERKQLWHSIPSCQREPLFLGGEESLHQNFGPIRVIASELSHGKGCQKKMNRDSKLRLRLKTWWLGRREGEDRNSFSESSAEQLMVFAVGNLGLSCVKVCLFWFCKWRFVRRVYRISNYLIQITLIFILERREREGERDGARKKS